MQNVVPRLLQSRATAPSQRVRKQNVYSHGNSYAGNPARAEPDSQLLHECCNRTPPTLATQIFLQLGRSLLQVRLFLRNAEIIE